ncbi:138_t:CDS:1 [Ambispora leptoticha]|uniref:138_t:CDS:1 n=1 Tax=Ambispora leptoticha TaxID=144679 RepID=A0A9N9ASZ0_9GLOM|nr:138_t:CDS:1 [Ambispora leptoticha]
MVKNQIEFNEKYDNKEIDEIEIKRKNFQGSLIIENYSKLEEIYLYNVLSIDEITLKNLPQLEKCTIRGCGVKKLAIENCSQIKELNVESNFLTSLEFVKNLPNLQRLEVDGNSELASGLEYLPKGIKFSCDNTKLPSLQQKYENLKGVMTSVAKEAKKEILKGIEAKEEISEQKVLKTDEIIVDLTKGIEGLKEVKEELKTNLEEAEKKVQKLEKELIEAKARAEQRQKKVAELDQEHSLETEQTPINEKTINFLRAKSIFLNARQETIGELKKCFIALENKYGRNEVIGEVGKTIVGVGDLLPSTITFGVPKIIGETIQIGNNFSKIMLTKEGNERFQLSLKDEQELIQLHKDYDLLIEFINNNEESEENESDNILNLKSRTRDGKA